MNRVVDAALMVGAIVFCCGQAHAQYLGLNLRGDLGLKAGSQPGPGIYITLPLYYRNFYDGLRGPNGLELLTNLDVDINIFAVPALAVTTKSTFLGATYGFQVVPMVMNQRLALAEIGFERGTGYGFGDLYAQPVNLGWRTARADFLAGYGFYAPTGTGDRTLDMWAHEIIAGFTVYPDSSKQWNVSSVGFWEIHHTKRDSDIKVGQIVTLEGGVGRSFRKGAGNAGVAYVAHWKVTRDSGSDIPPGLPLTKGRAFGLGPDIAMPVFAKGGWAGLIGFRYLWEFGARTNFDGQDLVVSLTFARMAQ